MRWAQSRSLPAGDVFRARLILALGDGMTYDAIQQSLHTSAPTISRWKQRFEEFGINLTALQPGQSMTMYHQESYQEGFLVLRGECLLIVDEADALKW